ncbi:putative Flp pilus assembly CpaB [Cupriavidus taiwanensis]|uniref:Flp pilus assembly CpaB n=1 Tax=Cupriavidus taiwanensis TaxID=164546 RepID=A0A976G515_9BURK|nr:Flp pilus assembly protein CpaB [Cupriavidus taiwanensis]SOZ19019.1 putative Flp pilus assembly CpaB [Cupriavidus taiwanensis]SOZ32164.1 putative Flp pilus assembly CpaB [Cupriavidus taiwanensis]SOZ47769.1 putative Flp pilus assembly CpaB [Cupriavidus taiwanensis]SOZ68202.1 putative Flp pilus assembly CpaB [Cupriavidus taiwanensis]SOZ69154.1 putative Flp pilus assembly CpaB [Cupriavidus taiwanensis]
MTSKQIRLLAIVLLGLAMLLALLAWQVGRQPAQPAASAGARPLHPVVVTTRPAEAGKPLDAEALKVEMLPIDPAGAYREVARVTGQVPLVALGANVPVLESQLLSGLAAQVPEGERAVAVSVDEVIGVGNQVQPGDYVDVFLVLRRDQQEIPDSQARMLLSRLRVLAYGVASVNRPQAAKPEQMMARQEGAKTAVLSVPLEQVSRLAMAQHSGRLMLALRNPQDPAMPSDGMFAEPPPALAARAGVPADAARAATDKATAGVLLSGLAATNGAPAARAPAAAPAPRPLQVAGPPAPAQARERAGVEVIRAGKRDIE